MKKRGSDMKFRLACAAGLSLYGALVASSSTIPASAYIQNDLVANWDAIGDVSAGTARHRVRLTQDFFCGLFPVSRKQFECLTGASHNQDRATSVSAWCARPKCRRRSNS